MSTSPEENPVPEVPPFVPVVSQAPEPQQVEDSVAPTPPAPVVPPAPVAPPAGYGYPQSQEAYSQQPATAPYGAPAPQQSPYAQPVYAGPQQGYQQPAGYGQTPYAGYDQQPQQGYQNAYPGYDPYNVIDDGHKSASNSLTMGIIGLCLAFLIGWIPLFGLLGVGGGIGLGVPAILQAKRAELAGANATTGKVLGWVSIGVSAFWVVLYIFLFILGSTMGHNTTSV